MKEFQYLGGDTGFNKMFTVGKLYEAKGPLGGLGDFQVTSDNKQEVLLSQENLICFGNLS